MEIIAAAFAIGLLGLVMDRQNRTMLFPPQVCGSCPEMIHFDFKHRIWVHDDGQQWKPIRGIETMQHPALPRAHLEPEQ